MDPGPGPDLVRTWSWSGPGSDPVLVLVLTKLLHHRVALATSSAKILVWRVRNRGGDYRMTLGRCVVEKLWSGLVVWSGLVLVLALVVLINSTAVAYT